MSDLYPLHDAPALTWGCVYTLLPVVHKYNFPKLLTRLMAFIKEESEALDMHDPDCTDIYVFRWLALAERLQLDVLRELCLDKVQVMTSAQLRTALTVTEEGCETDLCEHVKRLSQELRAGSLLLALALASDAR
ncbi:hypothetical protein FOA52_013282 [Chlamydomonas sp. UWO 241]|nr:hypothetical protein FOA52_013282 [Chlamydomonas sp. UWO 241]